jgi:hypothetical protein
MTILASVNNKSLMPGITAISDVPDAPTIGTATAAGLSASITFTPATTGGAPTTYTAISTPGLITGTSSSSPVTVSGLSDGTSYTFTVRASNSTGSSPVSGSSNSIDAVSPVDSGYDSLASITVPSGGLASITFSGIPAGYRHLQIRGVARTTRSAVADGLRFEFNGDTSTSYYSHSLYGAGSSFGSYASANKIESWVIGSNDASTNVFGAFVTDILDYSNSSKNTTIKTFTGIDNNGSGQVAYNSGVWLKLHPVSSIRLFSDSAANFMTYSQFSLYGVK